MIKVFRIAQKAFIHDLSGEGSRRYGGRWNKKGDGVLYTSDSRALATVEYLVHLPLTILANGVCIAEIHLPDDTPIQTISPDTLPHDWTAYPAPSTLADIGALWRSNAHTLALKIPSVVVKNEWNYLLNPEHPLFKQVYIHHIEDYLFDERLLR